MGEVYLLDFKGHKEPDPIGTPVDRCARISKFAKPGTVVTTLQFAKETKRNGLAWTLAGSVDLKGIGETQIYQLGSEVTIVVADPSKQNLAKISQLEEENRLLGEANAQLKHQLVELGQRPVATSPIPGTQEDLDEAIDRLKELINSAAVPKGDYARFLFLNRRGEGQEYNKYNRAFDECIEENLVEDPGDNNYYILNTSNRRNMKAVEAMENIEFLLGALEPDEDDLFDYSLKEPAFWSEKIGYSVK